MILFILLFGRLFHRQHRIFVLYLGPIRDNKALIELFFDIFVIRFIILYGRRLFLLFRFFPLAARWVFLGLTRHQILFGALSESGGLVLVFLAFLDDALEYDESHG